MSDFDLLTAHRDGDATAFETLYARHAVWMYLKAMRIARNEHAAEDIVQESFAKLHATATPPTNVRGWLAAVVHNASLTYHRDHGQNRPHALLDDSLVTEAIVGCELEGQELQYRVNRVLDTMFESDHEVISLYYFGGNSCPQIAARMGVRVETAKSRLKSALRGFSRRWYECYGAVAAH
jgi:RNA polymerase sigma-70 factor (ECF subfamily)